MLWNAVVPELSEQEIIHGFVAVGPVRLTSSPQIRVFGSQFDNQGQIDWLGQRQERYS